MTRTRGSTSSLVRSAISSRVVAITWTRSTPVASRSATASDAPGAASATAPTMRTRRVPGARSASVQLSQAGTWPSSPCSSAIVFPYPAPAVTMRLPPPRASAILAASRPRGIVLPFMVQALVQGAGRPGLIQPRLFPVERGCQSPLASRPVARFLWARVADGSRPDVGVAERRPDSRSAGAGGAPAVPSTVAWRNVLICRADRARCARR